MKKLICILSVLCLLAGLPMSAGAEVSVEPVLQFMPSIKAVAGTGYVIIQSKTNSAFGLFTTDGEELIPCKYRGFTYHGYNFFSSSPDPENLNTRILFRADGTQISDGQYGYFKAYSNRWVAGYVLSEATKKQYDIKISKKYYNIDHTDLFFVPDQVTGNCLAASREGHFFAKAQAHGDYISVADAEGAVTVYNGTFKPMPVEAKEIKTSVYRVKDYQVKDMATGRVVADKFTAVKEKPLTSGLRLIVTRYSWDGTKISGVIDPEGNEYAPVELYINDMTDQYILLSTPEKKAGLYSMDEARIIVPCEFEKLFAGKNTTQPYVFNDYVLVQRDGLMCFYDVKNQRISCETEYNAKEVSQIGCVLYVTTEDGILLIAADGAKTKLNVDAIAETHGDGYLLVAEKDGLFGVIDWHGNEVLPFCHKTAPVISADSKVLIRVGTGAEMDRIVR